MQAIYTIEDAETAAREYAMVLLYFTRDDCVECGHVESKIDRICRRFPKMLGLTISLDETPTAASRFSIYAVPGVVVYVEGKPAINVVREFSLQQLSQYVGEFYRKLFFAT